MLKYLKTWRLLLKGNLSRVITFPSSAPNKKRFRTVVTRARLCCVSLRWAQNQGGLKFSRHSWRMPHVFCFPLCACSVDIVSWLAQPFWYSPSDDFDHEFTSGWWSVSVSAKSLQSCPTLCDPMGCWTGRVRAVYCFRIQGVVVA